MHLSGPRRHSTDRFLPTRGGYRCALVLIAATCVFFYKFVFFGQVALNADWLVSQFRPWRQHYREVVPYNVELDDPIVNIFPLKALAAGMIREGRLPLWNPHIMCGIPLLANGACFPFEPFMLLYLILPAAVAHTLTAMLQLLVAGFGVFLLCRHHGANRVGALLAGLVFMFNDTTSVWLEYEFWLNGFCWVPFALLFVGKAVEQRRAAWALLAGGAVGLCFLGGQLQIALYALAVVCAYAAVCWLVAWRRAGGMWPRVRSAGWITVGLTLGIILAGIQLVPTAELVTYCQRSPTKYAGRNFYAPAMALTLVMPHFYGSPTSGQYFVPHVLKCSYVQKHGGYVGILALLLAAIGALTRREVWTHFFTALSFGMLAFLLLLCADPFHRIVLSILPSFDAVDARRLMMVYVFGLSMLAGLGLSSVCEMRGNVRAALRTLIAAGTVLTAVVVCGVVLKLALRKPSGDGFLSHLAALQSGESVSLPGAAEPVRGSWSLLGVPAVCIFIGALVASGALLCCWLRGWLPKPAFYAIAVSFALLELLCFTMRYNPFVDRGLVYPRTETTDYLQELTERAAPFRISGIDPPDPSLVDKGDLLLPDTAVPYGLCDVRGKDSLYPKRYRELMDQVKLNPDVEFIASIHLKAYRSPILNMLNMRYVLSTEPLRERGFTLVHQSEVSVYENERALPRGFFVYDTMTLPGPGGRMASSEAVLERLRAGSFDPRRQAILEEPLGEELAGAGSPGKWDAKPSRYEPQHASWKVSSDGPGLFVVSDAYYPGWRAFVDGERRKIHQTNYVMRAVAVPAGEHEVAFHYEPCVVRVGAALSLAAIALLTMAGVRSWWPVRRG